MGELPEMSGERYAFSGFVWHGSVLVCVDLILIKMQKILTLLHSSFGTDVFQINREGPSIAGSHSWHEVFDSPKRSTTGLLVVVYLASIVDIRLLRLAVPIAIYK